MAQFHFVEDYEKLVASLVATYPIDEAMSRAVGGSYELLGQIEVALLKSLGLKDGMRIVDLGCGSGRLASVLHNTVRASYVGIDIVQALLDYAKTKAPGYEFILNRGYNIPQPDASADLVTAFSVFTHLLHTETYLYLEEFVRILKPGGRIVFSFMEFAEPGHWQIFQDTCAETRASRLDHLNMYIERTAIEVWAVRLGLVVDRFIDSSAPLWNGHPLSQSIVILRHAT